MTHKQESSIGFRPLRIAVIAPPYYEVPPRSYGGTELVCHLLVEGLVDRGHDVTLVAAGPSHTRAGFVATFPEPQPEGMEANASVEVLHAGRAADALDALDLDVVHDHTLAGPLIARSRAIPTVVTVHAPVAGPDSQASMLAVLGRWAFLVAISEAHRRGAPGLNWIGTVHNGIPVEQYPFRDRKERFALCLGRIGPHKGVHLAIDAAREAGWPLVIAGAPTVPSEHAYFDREVRPRLGAGVEWVREVTSAEKKALLARAACLLFPARWEEPFGLVIVEAMACGTPVVGLRAGAVPELVAHRQTGIVCDTPAQLPRAIELATRLDPGTCRAGARRFGVERMVTGYETVYRRIASRPSTAGLSRSAAPCPPVH